MGVPEDESKGVARWAADNSMEGSGMGDLSGWTPSWGSPTPVHPKKGVMAKYKRHGSAASSSAATVDAAINSIKSQAPFSGISVSKAADLFAGTEADVKGRVDKLNDKQALCVYCAYTEKFPMI